MSKHRTKKRIKKPPNVQKKRLHQQAWSLARSMMEIHTKTFDRSLCNIHVHCQKCGRSYCLGFDGVDQYCEVCPYKPYYVGDEYIPNCQKPVTGFRNCQKCRGRDEANKKRQ